MPPKLVRTDNRAVELDYWMGRVLQECDRTRKDFSARAVHDLRVALRRCRSVADGYMALDPHSGWKQMKDESKRLFRRLGKLRDTQVMKQWVLRLASEEDKASRILTSYLSDRERRLRKRALEAVMDFNRKDWAASIRLLLERARRIPQGSPVFRQIALERWSDAHQLHRRAMQNRSYASYHQLRIGLKKFRYTVEIFFPSLYASWGADLKELQDLLGRIHDLQVLWRTSLAIKAAPGKAQRNKWHMRISEECDRCLEKYRRKMLGKASPASVWKSELLNLGPADADYARTGLRPML